MERRGLAWTALIALLLGFLLAPRPSTEPAEVRAERVTRRPMPAPIAPRATSAVVGSLSRPFVPAQPVALPPTTLEPLEAAPHEPEEEPVQMGWISGHVVDGDGTPLGGAILHLSGPTGSEAHRIADDGEFHFAVAEGAWTVEAGWLDGEDEWRSIATSAHIRPGATATLAIEVLLGSAGHAVRSGIRETLGVGWEVLRDDGPLHAGDVIVEIDGQLLTDMQPEAVRAALRERPGEAIRALVLRASSSGHLAEVPVVLEAR